MTTKPDKNNIKCLVFDLDGTLLDTIKTINYYLNRALAHHNLPSVSEAETMSFVGDGARKLIERAIDRVGADKGLFDSIFTTYNREYNADPYYLTEAYEGITELLRTLKALGYRLAVLSNKPDFAVKATVIRFFPETFDIVRGGIEGVPLKPDPTALWEIISNLGFDLSEVAYIGDSEVDVLTAKNAEISNGIFVTWGFRDPDALISAGGECLIDHPSELINRIKTVVS